MQDHRHYLLHAREMKQADQNTSKVFGIPPNVLMERAALKVVEAIQTENMDAQDTLVVCGAGNNGGDGMAVARMLSLMGNRVTVWLAGEPEKCSEEAQKQYRILKAYQIPVVLERPQMENGTHPYTLIVDALLGIGISRDVEGRYREAIEAMNALKAGKVAIDIPSGIHADSGAVMGCAFFANLTVTFAFDKLGLRLYPGADAAGKVVVADIGITRESFLGKEPMTAALDEWVKESLPGRWPDSNKGAYGKVLVVAGSEDMAGAAYFAAKAAYLCGCGLVKVFTHEKNRCMLNARLPEALIVGYDGKKGWKEELIEAVHWSDVIVIGPGLGQSDLAAGILKTTLMSASVPIVVDADALNLLARDTERLKRPHTDLILTPHLGEMSRLIDMPVSYIKKNLLEAAQEFAREYNVICVQKDARTIVSVPYGKTYVNLSGNHGMATAGSGDVLSGMIGGLLAGGMPAEEAAAAGVWLHGCAGDRMIQKTGYYSLLASDILDGIKEVMR